MTRTTPAVLVAATILSGAAAGETNLTWNAGADERIRHEIVNNLPRGGRAGNGGTVDGVNWIRFRTRVWGEVAGADLFRLYLRVGNEFRWYPTGQGPGGNVRNWRFPDEIYLDNLYVDFNGLFDGLVDFRGGRQDFLGAEAYGSKRVIGDGTSGDDSRTDYFDAIRARIHFSDTEKTDVLAIWDDSSYFPCFGDHGELDRERNAIVQGAHGMVEGGGGLYHRSRTLKQLPTDVYCLYKHESDESRDGGETFDGRDFCTLGVLTMPKFTRNLSGEFELAAQAGAKENGKAVGGHMAYAGLQWNFRPEESFDPWTRVSCYYMSGDEHRNGNDDTDYAWDPAWSRWPQFSDLWVKTFMYGIAYWSNLVYPALDFGFNWRDFATFKFATGPLFAAVDDGLGCGDGGNYIGHLSSVQLGIPLVRGLWDGRGSVITHVRNELLNPGGHYLDSERPACYFRWDVTLSF